MFFLLIRFSAKSLFVVQKPVAAFPAVSPPIPRNKRVRRIADCHPPIIENQHNQTDRPFHQQNDHINDSIQNSVQNLFIYIIRKQSASASGTSFASTHIKSSFKDSFIITPKERRGNPWFTGISLIFALNISQKTRAAQAAQQIYYTKGQPYSQSKVQLSL